MEKLELMLGETSLGRVITPLDEERELRVAELDKIIQNSHWGLPIEQKALVLLRSERAGLSYPELDLSFLSMSREIAYKDEKVKLPRFAVYPLKGNNKNWRKSNNNFSVSYAYENIAGMGVGLSIGILGGALGGAILPLGLFEPSFYDHSPIAMAFPLAGITIGAILGGYLGIKTLSQHSTIINNGSNRLPEIICRELIRGTEFSDYEKPTSDPQNYALDGCPPKNIREKMKKIRNITFSTELNAIIPDQTKTEISKAIPIFQDELYVIAEVQPTEWNAREYKPVSRDPLIIGILNDKARLVGSFDPTRLETAVSGEFSSIS